MSDCFPSEDTEPILATSGSLWDVSLWAVKPCSAPGSFLTPHSLSEQSSCNSGPVSERAAVWKSQNLTLQGMCSLIRTFMNVCSGQERLLQEISRLGSHPIHLCCKNDGKTSDFGLAFSKPRFVKPPRSLSKTAFEYKWKVSRTRMTFGSYFNITSSNHRAWIRKSFNPAALRARKVRVLFTLSMRRLASARWKTSKWSSAALLLPPGYVLGDSFPPEETISAHEEVQRRVTGSEKWVYCTGVPLFSGVIHFTARLRPFVDWRNNRSIFNAENKIKQNQERLVHV